jgi:hypothetical protein
VFWSLEWICAFEQFDWIRHCTSYNKHMLIPHQYYTISIMLCINTILEYHNALYCVLCHHPTMLMLYYIVVLSCFVLSCRVSSCLVTSRLVLCYLALSCVLCLVSCVLSCHVSSCRIVALSLFRFVSLSCQRPGRSVRQDAAVLVGGHHTHDRSLFTACECSPPRGMVAYIFVLHVRRAHITHTKHTQSTQSTQSTQNTSIRVSLLTNCPPTCLPACPPACLRYSLTYYTRSFLRRSDARLDRCPAKQKPHRAHVQWRGSG